MKQINIRVDDKLAAAIYAKLANHKGTMQSLVQGFFESWLNEDGVSQGLQTENSQDLQQNLLNDVIMAKLNQLEKNQDELIEWVANDSNDSINNSNQIESITDNDDSDMLAIIAKVESIEIEFREFKETIKNQLAELKNHHPGEEIPSHKKLKKSRPRGRQIEIGSKGITRLELSKLLGKAVRTIENHSKDIETYTKSIIGKSYKYEVKTRLYYPTND